MIDSVARMFDICILGQQIRVKMKIEKLIVGSCYEWDTLRIMKIGECLVTLEIEHLNEITEIENSLEMIKMETFPECDSCRKASSWEGDGLH